MSFRASLVTVEGSLGSNMGHEQAARISPVSGTVTTTLPLLASVSLMAWVSCSSATRCTLTSSETMMSVPSVASWISETPPATGVPSRPRSMSISPSVPLRMSSYCSSRPDRPWPSVPMKPSTWPPVSP